MITNIIIPFVIGSIGSFIMSSFAYKKGYQQGARHTWDIFVRCSCQHGIPFKYKWESVVNRSGICPECLALGELDDASAGK